MADAKIVPKREKPSAVIYGGATKLEVRTDKTEAEAVGERISRVIPSSAWSTVVDGIPRRKEWLETESTSCSIS